MMLIKNKPRDYIPYMAGAFGCTGLAALRLADQALCRQAWYRRDANKETPPHLEVIYHQELEATG